MPTIYRQKRSGLLTPEQQQKKLAEDKKYEEAVQAESAVFYQKKRTAGVTPEEQAVFDASQRRLWDDYQAWAIQEGLYEEVSVEKQREEAENALVLSINMVNDLRRDLDMKELELNEKAVRV